MSNLNNIIRQLRWKLTLSYTAVTVGSLLVVVLAFGLLLLSIILLEFGQNIATIEPFQNHKSTA